jgi:hypothetical protein
MSEQQQPAVDPAPRLGGGQTDAFLEQFASRVV